MKFKVNDLFKNKSGSIMEIARVEIGLNNPYKVRVKASHNGQWYNVGYYREDTFTEKGYFPIKRHNHPLTSIFQ